ncbi:MAG: hypothetical protein EAZ08_11865 [Cytophagales bacterium]|nr:MAG: hypothetical protein EAZ08_11865 [Cytophagales bacterium]
MNQGNINTKFFVICLHTLVFSFKIIKDDTILKLPETIYQLEETVPMHRSFVGKFIGGFILAWMGIWFGGFFFKLAFIVSALALLLPLAVEFWRGQLKSILLTADYLEFRVGLEGRKQRIYLSEIKRVALIEKEPSYRATQKNESTTVLIEEKKQRKIYDSEAKCVISTVSGKKYEIKSAYFPEGEFEEFLDYLTAAHSGKNSLNSSTANSSLGLEKAKDDDKVEQVMHTNIKRLHEDLQLKKAFEQNMIEAYKSIYRIRDGFDIAKMVDINIIYEFKNIDYSTSYILEKDYLPELDEEGVEFGQNLIDAVRENLILIEQRIAFYKKIDKELEKIKIQQQSRRKLQAVAQNLKNLQEKNTNKIIEESFSGNELDMETRILSELEYLSQKVHNLDDIEKSVQLKEHISWFKKQ